MVVGSSQLHRGRSVGAERLVHIVFHVDLEPYFDPAMMMYYRHFSEAVRPLEELNYIFEENAGARDEVARILERIHAEMMSEAGGYEIAISMHIKHLLLTLLRGDRRGRLEAHERVDAELMRSIVQYVERRLSEKIELEEASRLAGMSYHYFSKYFKRATGASFTDYVNRKRIAKAERLLVTSGRSIAEVASEVGIGNMAHFYELFKRFNGCTPKQYARNMNAGLRE
jgi:AraC-like DNA-binding protein